MRKHVLILPVLILAMTIPHAALATNGDNLIGVGPISRSMGGVGIAAPQDAISAVFANPAAMCFGPYCPSTDFDFAGTLFAPDVSAKLTRPGTTVKEDSDDEVYAIPAIGISVPITKAPPFWRFGLAAFGVSGLGVDYRGSDLDQPEFFDFGPMGKFPLISGEFTNLQIMRFAPAVAFQPSEKWSFGMDVQVDYSSLDLRNGSEFNYGFGAQGGVIFKPMDNLSLGLTYVTERKVTHKDVADFDGDGRLDDLDLAAPQEAGIGIAYTFRGKWLIEADGKWVNWSNADGYEDFDWDDQWMFSIGAQFQPIPKLTLRAGYNYARNPVDEHNGFNGMNPVNVQGKFLPGYYFETFRIIGFPAIIEHHLGLGIGYEFSPSFSLHFGYVHGFENTVRETGTDITGQPVTIESELSEDSFDFGLVWRF